MFASLRRGIVAGITVAALIFGLGIYPTAVSMAQSALTAPAEAPGVISFQPLVNGLLPYLVEFVIVGGFALASIVAAWAKRKWGIDAEAGLRIIQEKHRNSLHSAIYTAVANQIAAGKLGTLEIHTGSPQLAEITNYLLNSVPDAIEAFKPTDAVIAQIATAKAVELQAKVAPAAAAIGFDVARPQI